MVRYQIILAYDGTGFHGSQRQARTRTVQVELEKALRHIGWQGSSILLAGRTDTGVHASGQVAAFDLEWNHGLQDLRNALNAALPADLVVRRIELAAPGFHPRFHATSRRYRYVLFFRDVRDPLRERYAWRLWPPLTGDLAPLAGVWIGTHDFAAFGSPTTPRGGTVRTVHSASWTPSGEQWIFEIQADAFLYRMVRRLVYLQVAAGQGRVTVEDLQDALSGDPAQRDAAIKRLPAGLAQPNGLTLVEVKYDDLD